MIDIQIHCQDCIPGMLSLADGSVDMSISSIPFGALFSYSHKGADIGNNKDGETFIDSQFGLHLRWWLAQHVRVLAPGAVLCIHIQQLSSTVVQHGHMGIRDFRGDVIQMARRHGLIAHGEVAIPKNPQRVAQARKLHSLMFVTGRRDSRALAPACNDYVLFFRQQGEGKPVRGLFDKHDNPAGQFTQEDWIKWARGCWGDTWEDERLAEMEGFPEALERLRQEEWAYSSVWDDILEIDTLEGWRSARETDEERHVCPLQLEVIRRCLRLYTDPGDLVLDSFMGIGSTACVCVELDRRCVGYELKESYHRMAVRNVERWREKFSPAAIEAQMVMFAEGAT